MTFLTGCGQGDLQRRARCRCPQGLGQPRRRPRHPRPSPSPRSPGGGNAWTEGATRRGRLRITADAGGANSYRSRTFKVELVKLAASTGLVITAGHKRIAGKRSLALAAPEASQYPLHSPDRAVVVAELSERRPCHSAVSAPPPHNQQDRAVAYLAVVDVAATRAIRGSDRIPAVDRRFEQGSEE